jgi:hypothetical protein
MTVSITTFCIKCHYAESRNLFFGRMSICSVSLSLVSSCWVHGILKGGSITVPLTSFLTGLESAAWHLTISIFICKTDYSKPVKQEVNGTMDTSPFSIPPGCRYAECRGARLLGQILPSCNNSVRWQTFWQPPQLLGGCQWRNDD